MGSLKDEMPTRTPIGTLHISCCVQPNACAFLRLAWALILAKPVCCFVEIYLVCKESHGPL